MISGKLYGKYVCSYVFWWPNNEDILAYLEDGVLSEIEPVTPIN